MRNIMLEVYPVTSFYQFVFPEAPSIQRVLVCSSSSTRELLKRRPEALA